MVPNITDVLAECGSVTNVELLHALAESYGFGTSYRATDGRMVSPPPESFVALLRALGLSLDDDPTDEELHFHLDARREHWATRPLPPTVVATQGREQHFNVHVHDGHPAHCWIRLEDGSSRDCYQDENWAPPFTASDGVVWGEATFHTPGDLPAGWHELHLESDNFDAVCTLLVVPDCLSTNSRVVQHPIWGVMAQLYSVRSAASWGLGDFGDLALLAETVAAQGADYLLINPVHAAQPVPPVEDSPYLPTSRRFINPLYIAVEQVPEFELVDDNLRAAIAELAAPLKDLNTSPAPLDRDRVFAAKLAALRELFWASQADAARTHDFELFCLDEGEGLREFATWCAAQAAESEHHPEHRSRHAGDDIEDLVQFYMWLQFIADEQLRLAQERATAAGMSIGIMTDLAVGIHAGGADAATLREVLVSDASVGAPPDQYSQKGQDWSQPPWNPHQLAESGYGPWRDLLRTALRHSGGIRVDHVLGLFRLFWVPRAGTPADGVYMNYDFKAMVGTLVLEAQRAGAVVVGEDLGTFEPWVQDFLRDKGILGTSVLWFESIPPGVPRPSQQYRHLALTAVGTHDLPPTAGYLKGAHNELRHELGLVDDPVEHLNATDRIWIDQVLGLAREEGALSGDDDKALITGLTRFVASTPSAMTCTNLVDMVGDERIQNQPGTNGEQYTNWRMPLCDATGTPVLIEHLPEMELFKAVAGASIRN